MAIPDLIQQIKSELIDLDTEATERIEVLASLKVEKNQAEEAVKIALNKCDSIKKNAEQQAQTYIAIKDKLGKEAHLLEQEVNQLVQRKANLMIELTQLEKKIAEFKKYEANAWKKLEAKDAELQERERNVAEKENYSPRSKSFLPPVE